MIRNPIHKVLSSIQQHKVRALLMGGQACVLYGAAEFSRDTDLAILSSAENLSRLRAALTDLRAEVIAVPPFELKYLRKGHAVHFRCHHREAAGMRVDVMTRMRGVSTFSELWRRRFTMDAEDGTRYELMALPDLVKAKKTQRDKDWPMIRRLVEADFFRNQEGARAVQVRFWLRELRTPELLIDLASSHPRTSRKMVPQRPLLKYALAGDRTNLETALLAEEMTERDADRRYWAPLKAELERLRRERLRH